MRQFLINNVEIISHIIIGHYFVFSMVFIVAQEFTNECKTAKKSTLRLTDRVAKFLSNWLQGVGLFILIGWLLLWVLIIWDIVILE